MEAALEVEPEAPRRPMMLPKPPLAAPMVSIGVILPTSITFCTARRDNCSPVKALSTTGA